jgi:hypothetical protein
MPGRSSLSRAVKKKVLDLESSKAGALAVASSEPGMAEEDGEA